MGKHPRRESEVSKKGSPKILIIIGVIAAVAIGIGVAVVFGSQTNDVPADGSGSRTIPWMHVHGLGIDPTDPSILYVATHGDFYRSVDGGTPVKVDRQRADYMGFNAPPAAGVPLYASGHPSTGGNTGLIKSVDGGQTWEHVSDVADPPVDFHAMSVSKSNPNIIMGFDGGRGLFKTTDTGKTWQSLDYPGEFVIGLAISPTDIDIVFAATDDGLYQSKDGGLSWTQLEQYKGISVMAIVFDSEGSLYASTQQFALAKSADLGTTWESIPRPPNGLTATSIAVDLQNQLVYVAGFAAPQGYQEVYKSPLDGSDWQLVGTNR